MNREQVREMRAQGYRYREIARICGVSTFALWMLMLSPRPWS